jgi:heme exporter protein D
VNHLPYIAAAYGLTVGVIAWLCLDAALRTSRARRRLAAIDPRAGRDA